ncbi:putative deoxyribonuclease TATDN2 [Aplysia californica]|uniref:Deoxyribonuclease TATDN2 n=1 Tax=Aplysia californica TaxID=6500 RepID=A0ABM0JEL8_APLCA|nr:putative deoxyribonuclease TATDN2 [Aplysia californica]
MAQFWTKAASLAELVGRSRGYIHKFVDSHCHIDLLYSRLKLGKDHSYSSFLTEQTESFPANYEGCVAVFCYPKTFSANEPDNITLRMAGSTDNVWLAIGCHPKSATEFTDEHLQGLRSALQHPKVVALGEIGLDYSGTFSQHAETQKKVMRSQISLALELKLPLVIHCRDADDDCLVILKEMVPHEWPIHRHCFTQDVVTAHEWLSAFPRLYLGFTPLITRKTDAVGAVKKAAADVPLDRVLLETDAPYFVPEGVKNGVKVTHPGFALFTAECLAQLKDISVDAVLEACRRNTQDMYGV